MGKTNGEDEWGRRMGKTNEIILISLAGRVHILFLCQLLQ